MRVSKFVLASLCCALLARGACAAPFTELWIFGDSTVDTGWYRSTASGATSYDHYIQNLSLGVGRPTSSPGKMSVEVLATALTLTANPQNQSNGTNYATGGAKNVRKNLATGDGFPNAVPTVTQIKRYLAHHTASSPALYLISSGDNDVAFALKHPGNKQYLIKAANALATEIKALTQNGNHATHILVAGLTQSFGSPEKKLFRKRYNHALQTKLASLNVHYLWGDGDKVRTLMESFKNNPPGPFGITNYTLGSTTCTGPCSACTVPTPDPNAQPPITTDWAYVCSTSPGAPSAPTNDAGSEWADDAHFATGGQSVFGTYFYCAARKKWPALNWSTSPGLPFDCKAFSTVLQ